MGLMKNKIHRNVSGWIKQLRERAGLSLQDASQLLGYPQESLKYIEESDTPLPLRTLAKITRTYGASNDELVSHMITVQEMIRSNLK